VESTVEQLVVEFTRRHIPAAADRVSIDSRLVEDLGLEGEDALEFFEAYDDEFHVDLTVLINQNWKRHFGAVGGVHWTTVAGFFVCFLISEILHWVFGSIAQWILYLGLMLVWWGMLQFWPAKRQAALVPITVRDLVEAATAQRWVKVIQ
jgi:hypothetical protein